MNSGDMGRKQPAFLLAQLGAHAAAQFAEKMRVLDLTPADAGILRMLRAEAGPSQQELAARLNIHPSRLVALLDNLEKRALLERRSHAQDRRLYSLHLTPSGNDILAKIGEVAQEHQSTLLAALDHDEREALATLLLKVADQQGLSRGVHPGYRQMRKP